MSVVTLTTFGETNPSVLALSADLSYQADLYGADTVQAGLADSVFVQTYDQSALDTAVVDVTGGSDTVMISHASLCGLNVSVGGHDNATSVTGGGAILDAGANGSLALLGNSSTYSVQETGTDNVIRLGWSAADTVTVRASAGTNDTIDGGQRGTVSLLLDNLGSRNNVWLAADQSGQTSVTVGGGGGYTIENADPAHDQFSIGTLTIARDTAYSAGTAVRLSDGTAIWFAGFTGNIDALFAGLH